MSRLQEMTRAAAKVERRVCEKCGKPLHRSARNGEVQPVCFRCRRGLPLTPRDPLAGMLASFLKKADKMLAKADKLETRISLLHQQSTALRAAAEKLKGLGQNG